MSDTHSTEVDVERAVERENEELPGAVQDASEKSFEEELAESAKSVL
jgi:hypothetical protein